MRDIPDGYLTIRSGVGSVPPADLVVLPVLFEGEVLGVIEFASVSAFSELHLGFLDRLTSTIGVALKTILANRRTEELLGQSQRLATELQDQSAELQRTNAELEEKAALLSEQNRNIEIKNREIEMARRRVEEKAQQLAQATQYKSEFLANMSHELRTPLNSLLLLARLLADNPEHNLTAKQIEFARTIHNAGSDLLSLIDDILDLSKIEAGRMDVEMSAVDLAEMRELRRAGVPPAGRGQGPRPADAHRRGRRRDDRHRRAAPAADPAQPAVQRGEVHREGLGAPDDLVRAARDRVRRARRWTARTVWWRSRCATPASGSPTRSSR